MSVWTLSIPFETEGRGKPGMVRIGKDIWIISACDVFVFNTELQQLFKVDVVLPEIYFIVAVVGHVDKIYFWVYGGSMGYSLYQLDTNTRQVELVIMVGELIGVPVSPRIIGNVMYFQDYDFMTNSLLLRKIDLVGRRMLETQTLKTFGVRRPQYDLATTDNDLYLLETNQFEKKRTVFKIGADGLEQLHEEVYLGIVKLKCFDLFLSCDTEDEDPVHYLDSFDFKTNKWNRQKIDWNRRKSTGVDGIKKYYTIKIGAILMMDDMLYILVAPNTITDGYEIRMFEFLPSLEKRCILNVIDKMIESEDFSKVDEFEELLPPMLKQTARRMIHWRIKRHEYLMNRANNSQALREAREAPIQRDMGLEGLRDLRISRRRLSL